MSGVRADTDGIDPAGTVTPMASSSAPKPRKRRAPKRPLRGAAAAAADRGSLKPRRARENLDEADLQLIELLTGNGRLSNRALAAEIGLTEATVAARIRSLSKKHILGVTATLDWHAAGYTWDAWCEVVIGDRPLREVGEELAAIDGVHSVYVVFGPVDLLLHVLLPDGSDAVGFFNERLLAVKGVRRLRSNVALDTKKYLTKFAHVPVPPRPVQFPNPVVHLDVVDRALIEALMVDGRQSNRQIARNLEVSEGLVRTRLRRIESAGLLQITGQSDPFRTGTLSAWAFVGIDLESGSVDSVCERLSAMPDVLIVTVIAGSHDLLILVTASSRSRLVELVVEAIRLLDGVRSTETWEVVQTLGLNYHWARLL